MTSTARSSSAEIVAAGSRTAGSNLEVVGGAVVELAESGPERAVDGTDEDLEAVQLLAYRVVSFEPCLAPFDPVEKPVEGLADVVVKGTDRSPPEADTA